MDFEDMTSFGKGVTVLVIALSIITFGVGLFYVFYFSVYIIDSAFVSEKELSEVNNNTLNMIIGTSYKYDSSRDVFVEIPSILDRLEALEANVQK